MLLPLLNNPLTPVYYNELCASNEKNLFCTEKLIFTSNRDLYYKIFYGISLCYYTIKYNIGYVYEWTECNLAEKRFFFG